MGDAIRIDSDGDVRIVTLNRPETLNAFDHELHEALPAALRSLSNDFDAKAVVLTGAGQAFSAGGSVDDFERFAGDLQLRRQALRLGRMLFDDLVGFHLPIVAAVNGPAVGLGCTIATACDMVFVSEDTFFADPHVTAALVAGDGGAVTWPLNTGLLRAKEYLLTGDRIPADVAVQIGIANRAVPADNLMPSALAFAQRLAALPWQAVQDTKAVLNQHLKQGAVNVLGFGLAAESQSQDTAEFREIPAKFRKN